MNRSTALEANSEIEKLKTKINEILQELENSKKEMISIKSSTEKEKNGEDTLKNSGEDRGKERGNEKGK